MKKVLCVEDDPEIADLLQHLLTDSGYSVTLAGKATEALKLAGSFWPDVVLLDLGLPDMDGFELCTLLRQEFGAPIIMVTARAGEGDMISGFEHGADDYVTKPFNIEILLHRLIAVMRYSPSAAQTADADRPGPASPSQAPDAPQPLDTQGPLDIDEEGTTPSRSTE